MKTVSRILIALLALIVVAACVFGGVYFTRFQSIASIEKLSDYADYNLYRMDVKYDYNLDGVLNAGIHDNQSFIDALLKESLPLLPIKMKAPDFGCSAFTALDADGTVRFLCSEQCLRGVDT